MAGGSSLGSLFPPIDHLHSANPVALPKDSFAQIGVEGWMEFMEEVGIDAAALFPTGGLSYGRIVNPDSVERALSLARRCATLRLVARLEAEGRG